MNLRANFYNLYCLSMNCRQSIYWNSVETRAIFDAENLAATHTCTCCGQSLFSAMDIEIKQITAEAGIISGRPSYDQAVKVPKKG
jgi:hypothetical protein